MSPTTKKISFEEPNVEEDHVSVHHRTKFCCTDTLSEVISIIFVICIAAVSCYAFYYGDIDRVVGNYDCYGNVCDRQFNEKLIANNSNSGVSTAGKPFVFQTYVTYWLWSRSICVKECPTEYITEKNAIVSYMNKTNNFLCEYNVPRDSVLSIYSSFQLYNKTQVPELPCPYLPVYPTTPLMGFCVRKNFTSGNPNEGMNQLSGVNRLQPTAEAIFKDFFRGWKENVILCAAAVCTAYLLILAFRFLSSVVAYFSIIFVFLASISLVAFLWICHFAQRKLLDAQHQRNIGFLEVEVINEQFFFCASIIVSSIMLLICIAIITMVTRLRVIGPVLKACTALLLDHPTLFLQPLWTLVLLSGFFLFWSFTLGYLVSIATPNIIPSTGCIEFHLWPPAIGLIIVHFWALIWAAEFIVACQQIILAGVTTDWYSAPDSSSIGWSQSRWTLRTIFQHTGSAALAGCLLPLVRLPRYFLLSLSRRVVGSVERNKQPSCCRCCAVCLANCCVCPLACLNFGLKFVTKSAYSIIALDAANFLSSGRTAHRILSKSSLRLTAVNSATDFVFMMAKFFVTFLVTCVALVVFMSRKDLYCYGFSVLIVGYFSFYLSHAVISLYETIVDSLLVSYCVSRGRDTHRNNERATDKEEMKETALHATLVQCFDHLNSLNIDHEDNAVDLPLNDNIR